MLSVVLAAFLVVLGASAPLTAQQEGGSGETSEEKPPWIPADLAPGAYSNPGPPPDPMTRVYDKRFSKVWKKLVKLLEQEGLELSSLDKGTGAIQTEIKNFDEVNGPFRNVATSPPKVSQRRPIRQWVRLDRGRYSLDIKVSEEEGTRVNVGVYIEERAYHVGEQVKIWVERYSNQTIEKYFLDKLEEAL